MRFFPILLAATVLAGQPALAAESKLRAALTGAAEVPGPGADKGKGEASLNVDTNKNQLCYMLHTAGSDKPTMAHLHKGAAGVAGGVVASLDAPADGMSQGCVPLAAEALADILAHPGDYYVNVHTAQFPKGAMRGQLEK